MKVLDSRFRHDLQYYQWKRLFLAEGDEAFVGKENLKPEEAEVKRQKEREEVKEERDILKKALGVFSKRNW